MEVRDELLTLAEFSIALAGFTGVVVVFGNRAGGWHPLDRYRIAIILWCSIGPAFLSLLPLGFEMLGISSHALWRLCSILLLVFLAGASFALSIQLRRLDAHSRALQSRIMFTVNRVALALTALAQLANAIGTGFRPGPGAYFLGLLFVLFVAAYVFARMVFVRPEHEPAA